MTNRNCIFFIKRFSFFLFMLLIFACNPKIGEGLRKNDLKKDVELTTSNLELFRSLAAPKFASSTNHFPAPLLFAICYLLFPQPP